MSMQPINLHHRKSIRLKEYDYSSPGEYFITICTKNRECDFGEIVSDNINLSPIGRIAEQCWTEIPIHFTNVELDAFIVMPNHLHGIIVINPSVGIHNYESLQKHAFQHTVRKSLGSIVRAYKGAVKMICQDKGYSEFVWQRNYYEHIIRNDKDLNNIRDYIVNNPMQWYKDEENPE